MPPREFNLLAIGRRAMLSRFHLDREVCMTTLHLARVAILTLALLVLPTALGAQPKGKVVRIGLLDFGAPNPSSEARWRATSRPAARAWVRGGTEHRLRTAVGT